ncbi:hypothetical protein B0181_06620 [Moraxella caviae]|uniref:Single-stranded DNA-binding protein n=1 Tax=Moraxella caviae TaxID=34060 RepID=A0A1T0A1H8_9GAMM|nr:single-stranded DNA-binding protein [Moraxella caviae]OOR89636.1 hypothetical protein B0181_06620 [Moraxella caviae]STZ10323.1 Helix-destabilizing protein [Moraxella caviae]
MSSVNKVIIVGRLGNDPEVRQFQNGGGVTNISVATSERWTDKNTGERKEQTEWHRISLFNRLGEIAAQYLRKGSMVYVEGSLQTRKYTDQQGVERYSTEIRASEMRMLSSNNDNQGGYGGGYQGGNQGGQWGNNQNRNFGAQNNQGYNNQNAYQNGGAQGFGGQNQNFGAEQNYGGGYQGGNQGGQNQFAGNQGGFNQNGGQTPPPQNGFANQGAPSANTFGAPKSDAPPAPSKAPAPSVDDDDIPF